MIWQWLLGILIAMGCISKINIDKIPSTIFIGELSLDGKINRTNGILPMCIEAKELGIKTVILPKANANEASIISELDIIPVSTIEELVKHLNQENIIPEFKATGGKFEEKYSIDFSEVKGQENVKRALILLHNLEPAGIGARDIKECLILQLKRLGKDNEMLEKIINNHLEDLADNKYQLIGKALKITAKEAQSFGDLIKTLEPKPSRGFYTGENMKFIIPDAEIKKIGNEFFIVMNDKVLPKLSINSMYNEILRDNDDKDAVKYIEEKIDKALFLVKSIDHRKTTLHKVLEKIVKKQRGYFEKGESALIPMTLKEIAEEIDMHESTVSRAIREKYILTSFGTIKIKDLFTNGIQTNGKNSNKIEDISVVNIKKIIEKMVNEEDKVKPLSDQIICEKLNKNGMNISRRTVAKYREEIGIKSSSKRKRF